jgi:two-component system sensor histidine kinase RegB
LENSPIQAVDRWLDRLRQHWHAMRPQTQSQLICAGQGQAPALLADPRLAQSVVNLLNNAVNASPQPEIPIEIKLDWDARHIFLELRDHGPGFSSAVLSDGGRIRFPVHAGGQGVGLLLTRSAIEQLGGQLSLFNAPDGGAIARLLIPQFTR